MSFETFIANRYLKTRKRHTFISSITLLALTGVTLGVVVLIVVIAVMSGAEVHLRSNILRIEAHVLVMGQGGTLADYRRVMRAVHKAADVESTSPFVVSQVMLRSANSVAGAVLKGQDPEALARTLENLSRTPSPPQVPADETVPVIFLGSELAESLKVREGDSVYLVSVQPSAALTMKLPRAWLFTVGGILESGLYSYDKTLALIDLTEAQKVLGMGEDVSGIEVRIGDIFQAETVAERIAAALGPAHWAVGWQRMHKNIFASLRLQKTIFFILLTLIVLVAAFNIATSLFMTVQEKTRDIAILKAMGATRRNILKIFVYKGMLIGVGGTLLGTLGGLGLSQLLKRYHFVELPRDVYFFTSLPIRLEGLDVALIALATITICFLATLYPAWQASRLPPAEALRAG
jgi:lipoprotein-releasing system permease protein